MLWGCLLFLPFSLSLLHRLARKQLLASSRHSGKRLVDCSDASNRIQTSRACLRRSDWSIEQPRTVNVKRLAGFSSPFSLSKDYHCPQCPRIACLDPSFRQRNGKCVLDTCSRFYLTSHCPPTSLYLGLIEMSCNPMRTLRQTGDIVIM